jgi:hypothetical protein
MSPLCVHCLYFVFAFIRSRLYCWSALTIKFPHAIYSNKIYNAITLRSKFGFIFRNYKFYRLWNQKTCIQLFTAYTAYYSKQAVQFLIVEILSTQESVTWPEEFFSCYFVSVNATVFGYWTHSLNTHQDDYTTRVPAVACHQS